MSVVCKVNSSQFPYPGAWMSILRTEDKPELGTVSGSNPVLNVIAAMSS